MQLNSLSTGFCACVRLLLALHSILVVEGNLAEVHIPVAVEGNLAADTPVEILVAADTFVVDTLEVVFAALQNRIVAARADQDLSHALLLVVRMVVPGCPYVSPS
jgi:hypothetical protein